MNRDGERLLYLSLGPIVAILIGTMLMPLRGVTVASNFGFLFLAWTFTVGELGGRGPALATALVSAISLDFFLTQPYLRLTIHGKDDVFAFLGLSGCGLLAAALGSPRRQRLEASRQLDVLRALLEQVAVGSPVEQRLPPLLDRTRAAFPLAALALRDEAEGLLAGSGDRDLCRRAPAAAGRAESLLTAGRLLDWRRGASLPEDGLRVPLAVAGRPVGSLDLWGDGRAADDGARRVLTAAVHAFAALLAPVERVAASPRLESAWVTTRTGASRE